MFTPRLLEPWFWLMCGSESSAHRSGSAGRGPGMPRNAGCETQPGKSMPRPAPTDARSRPRRENFTPGDLRPRF